MKDYHIYKLTNQITGMAYIGQTTSPLYKRTGQGTGYKNTPYLEPAINTYGWNSFSKELLLTVHSSQNADFAEALMTQVHNTLWPNGYNECLGRKRSEECKNKIRNTLTGTHPSEKTRKKHSDSCQTKKEILQFDLNGQLIAEYPSISEASRQTKIPTGNISACCRKLHKTAGRFIFEYKTQ